MVYVFLMMYNMISKSHLTGSAMLTIESVIKKDWKKFTASEQRLALFTWLQPAPIPGYAMFEMNIGDGALELTGEEVAGHFARVMRSAR